MATLHPHAPRLSLSTANPLNDDGLDRRVPGDWEPVQCVWLSWPSNPNTWPGHDDHGERFVRIANVYRQVIETITKHTEVRLLVSPGTASQAETMVGHLPHVQRVTTPTNDVWIRDYGPTWVQRRSTGAMVAIDWRYNAWGGKHPPWDEDDRAAKQIAQQAGISVESSDLCTEGGALEFDGDRRVLTTPGCLIDPARNPGWTRPQIEQELRRRTGVTEIVWVDGGSLEGDDTDGHIDQIARFVDPSNLVVAVAEPSDANHDGLRRNFEQLTAWGQQADPPVKVHRLPIPPPRKIDGQRVPESYCNYLRLGERVIIMPTFGADTDDQASAILEGLTGARIETVDCRELVWGLGALHCCSRDQPRESR